ncbi:hypothetical protein Agub_g2960, partial [Astrephomene gubernaculifera]
LGGVMARDARRARERPMGRSGSSSTDKTVSGGSGAGRQLGPGDERMQLGRDEDPDLVEIRRGGTGTADPRAANPRVDPGTGLEDPRRDFSRDPGADPNYSARELKQFDEQLRRKEEKRRRRKGGAGGGDGGGDEW